MIKTTLMALGLAAVFLLGTACFGLLPTKKEPAKDATIAECAGLAGQARADCEREHAR
jgi:hypothetical protein